MPYKIFVLITFTFSFYVVSQIDPLVNLQVNPQTKKLEDLFIWKISDELKLTPQEETTVSSIIKDTNKKRSANSRELEILYKKLKDETTDLSRRNAYRKIRTAHKTQGSITVEELDLLSKAIGLKKLALYLEVKSSLAEKIKSIWIQSEKKGGNSLPPPKIIEEK